MEQKSKKTRNQILFGVLISLVIVLGILLWVNWQKLGISALTLSPSPSFPTSFQPEVTTTRALLASSVAKAYNQFAFPVTPTFKDVTEGYWAEAAIEGLNKAGIMKGYGDGTFRPEKATTRADITVVVSRAVKVVPYDNPTPSFKDVPRTYWAYKEIEAMKKAGLIQGYADGTFKPDGPGTRATLAVTLYRAKALIGPCTGKVFSDVNSAYWACKVIEAVGAKGWMTPTITPPTPTPTPTASNLVSLYLSPSSGTYVVGQTFDVAIKVNPTNRGILGVDIKSLRYPTDSLEVVSITPGQYYSQMSPNPPVANNGTISFSALYNTYPSGWGFTVATVKFKVKSQVLLPTPPTYKQAKVSFDFTPGSTTDCNVTLAGYPGQDKLQQVVNATYSITR